MSELREIIMMAIMGLWWCYNAPLLQLMCWSCFLYGFPKRDKEHVQYAAAYQTRKRHCVFSCRSSRCVCYVLCLFVLWPLWGWRVPSHGWENWGGSLLSDFCRVFALKRNGSRSSSTEEQHTHAKQDSGVSPSIDHESWASVQTIYFTARKRK